MNEFVKSSFTKEELELAAAIGQRDLPLDEKVETLFRHLGDPLLAVADVQDLLGSVAGSEDVQDALKRMVEAGILEVSSQTLRPKDEDGIELYRLKGIPVSRLKLLALETPLQDNTSRFQFTCEGRLIRSIARIDRLDALSDSGQQREEIHAHVDRISQGIKSGIQIPNSILLVLSASEVVEEDPDSPAPQSFIIIRPLQEQVALPHPSRSTMNAQECRLVELDFPFREAAFDEEKTALLVDGQQRTAALSFVDVEDVPQYPLSVNAVVADAEAAKSVFQVANSTVKISTQFSRALTASMEDAPGYLREEQKLAQAVKRLSLVDDNSPFYHLVQYPGARLIPKPPVAYNSLFQVASIFAESGVTFEDSEQLAGAVGRAFNIVRKTWPSAWGKKPDKSRLMHGVGLRSLAALLAAKLEQAVVQEGFDGDLLSDRTWAPIEESISRLQELFIWSEDEVAAASKSAAKTWREETALRQNTNQDIAAFTSYIKKESLNQDVEDQKKKRKAAVKK